VSEAASGIASALKHACQEPSPTSIQPMGEIIWHYGTRGCTDFFLFFFLSHAETTTPARSTVSASGDPLGSARPPVQAEVPRHPPTSSPPLLHLEGHLVPLLLESLVRQNAPTPTLARWIASGNGDHLGRVMQSARAAGSRLLRTPSPPQLLTVVGLARRLPVRPGILPARVPSHARRLSSRYRYPHPRQLLPLLLLLSPPRLLLPLLLRPLWCQHWNQ
jgi:hypothetical protein